MRIQDHKLAWRWTDPAYAVLPKEVLAQMQPATPDEAEAMHTKALAFLGRDGLSAELRPDVIEVEDAASEAGASWLIRHQPHLEQPVLLSWDPQAALRTTWGVFISYWPEFCYAGADDLVVFPESEEWVLLYHHEQEFHFGSPRRCD